MKSTLSPQEALDLMEEKELGKFAKRMGQISQLNLLNSVLDQQKAVQSVARVRKAGDDAAIRALGGTVSEDDDMQTIIFGDVTNPVRHEKPQGLSTLAKLAIAGGLLASGAGAGAAIPFALDAFKAIQSRVVVPGESKTTERDYEIGEIKIEPGGE